MSTVSVSDLTRLARVDSAQVHVISILGGPELLLDVVAQRSGFNWELRILPGDPGKTPAEVEYFPYLVVETKIRPDLPKLGGPGPVLPPTPLHISVTHYGTKGIEVIGQDFEKKFDYQQIRSGKAA
jgi:hypothetical protein